MFDLLFNCSFFYSIRITNCWEVQHSQWKRNEQCFSNTTSLVHCWLGPLFQLIRRHQLFASGVLDLLISICSCWIIFCSSYSYTSSKHHSDCSDTVYLTITESTESTGGIHIMWLHLPEVIISFRAATHLTMVLGLSRNRIPRQGNRKMERSFFRRCCAIQIWNLSFPIFLS